MATALDVCGKPRRLRTARIHLWDVRVCAHVCEQSLHVLQCVCVRSSSAVCARVLHISFLILRAGSGSRAAVPGSGAPGGVPRWRGAQRRTGSAPRRRWRATAGGGPGPHLGAAPGAGAGAGAAAGAGLGPGPGPGPGARLPVPGERLPSGARRRTAASPLATGTGSGAGSAPGAQTAGTTATAGSGAAGGHQADLASVDVLPVQLVDGPPHVGAAVELDHALVVTLLVGVGKGHLPHLTHQVLEVLPAAAGGQVLYDEAVRRPDGGAVLISSDVTVSTAAPATAVLVPPGSPGELHHHPLSAQVSAVQLVHRVFRIAVVVKLHETKSVL